MRDEGGERERETVNRERKGFSERPLTGLTPQGGNKTASL